MGFPGTLFSVTSSLTILFNIIIIEHTTTGVSLQRYLNSRALISTNTGSINHLIKVIVLEGPKHTVTDDSRTQPILLVVLLGM